ncbi:hypothetical protein EDC65_1710 [Stella humosa]|uniref:DUF4089 domain-containing protein n=1 Tax=Stella humosa TaxID=94 RepID=A0A3N1MFD9_9PROT|nr:hypothetical protein [Stella humosa]ROP99915.1 hypothetical protein EDC65_1710 [Stella humosa]BBK30855.1 hypothetical protein STHU_14890 [Stella humosa]
MSEALTEDFLALTRQAGLTFTDEEAPRMHDAWLKMHAVLLSRLPTDADLTAEPALVFVPAGAGVAA